MTTILIFPFPLLPLDPKSFMLPQPPCDSCLATHRKPVNLYIREVASCTIRVCICWRSVSHIGGALLPTQASHPSYVTVIELTIVAIVSERLSDWTTPLLRISICDKVILIFNLKLKTHERFILNTVCF